MNTPKKPHNLTLRDRSTLFLSGVSELISFEETVITFDICGTMLTVAGNDFSVTSLDLEKGEASVSGNVDAIQYTEATSSKPLFGRLFKKQ